MKILCLIHKFDYSGAPKMMAWLANHLNQMGNNVYLVVLFSSDFEQTLDRNIHYIPLDVNRGKNRIYRNTIQMCHLIKKIKNVVDDIEPACIVSFLDASGYFISLINHFFWKKRNIRLVISERGNPYLYSGLSGFVKKRCMRYADVIVFQTYGAKRYFDKEIQSKSVVIPNPVISVKEYNPSSFDKRKNQIVTAGRLFIKQKRQDLLLEAYKIVREKHPEQELIIYGDGEDYDNIQKMISTQQIDNVSLPGSVQNVKEIIKDSKIFVLTSDYEGIPNALIEAMEVGLPCVATDCEPGGVRELIEDGKNGFVVPRNDPKALASKINILLESPELSNTFSQEAIKIKEVFSEEKIAELWKRAIHTDSFFE